MTAGAARLAPTTAIRFGAPESKVVRAVAREPARHVAVCDDDMRFIRYVERLLEQAGARICPVTTLDPHEAVDVVAGARCDAVMIDLHIYNDDRAGLTLVQLFREHAATASLPLLMVTGASPRDLKKHDRFLQSHGCALLPKPFVADALLNALGLTMTASVGT
jgi:CheY-like chemotaxis protein